MEFFNSIISDTLSSLSPLEQKTLAITKAWHDTGVSGVILQRDTVCELDGVGFNLVTSDEIQDEITVIGEDLSSLTGNVPFARISLIQLDSADDGQKAYNLIRKIEYVKYHCFPEGYMIRTSSRSHKEIVRVSKSAVRDGIDFAKIGSLYIGKFKENPAVKGVKMIFVTDPKADFKALEALAQKNNAVTETLNHVMNSVNFDCSTCNLKPICDEVEGMKELHFRNASTSGM